MIINCLLSFFIGFFGTIPYATRLVGIKTKLLALSFSLFNIIMLIARTSAGFQAPFLAKYIEVKLLSDPLYDPLLFFRILLLSGSAGCICGVLFIPFTQRVFSAVVSHYYHQRSFFGILKRGFTKSGFTFINTSLQGFSPGFSVSTSFNQLPMKLLLYHALATALFTTGVLSAMYAGFINPVFRTTCATLAFVIHGIATIIMFGLIDPPISILTDDCLNGKLDELTFSRTIYFLIFSRITGTFIAQFLFIPTARLISIFASTL